MRLCGAEDRSPVALTKNAGTAELTPVGDTDEVCNLRGIKGRRPAVKSHADSVPSARRPPLARLYGAVGEDFGGFADPQA